MTIEEAIAQARKNGWTNIKLKSGTKWSDTNELALWVDAWEPVNPHPVECCQRKPSCSCHNDR